MTKFLLLALAFKVMQRQAKTNAEFALDWVAAIAAAALVVWL